MIQRQSRESSALSPAETLSFGAVQDGDPVAECPPRNSYDGPEVPHPQRPIPANESAGRDNTGYDLGFSSASFGFLALDFAGAFDA